MGEYLSTPNKEKKSEEGENGKVIHPPLISYSFHLDKVWSFSNVRLEKKYGGFSHCFTGHWGWRRNFRGF